METSDHYKNNAISKSQTSSKIQNEKNEKNTVLTLVFIAISFALYITSCSNSQQKSGEEKTTVTVKPEDILKHGEYLVTILGCNDCHSPKNGC